MYKPLFSGAIALTCFAALGSFFSSGAIAQERAPLSQQAAQLQSTNALEQQVAQRNPRDPIFRRDDPSLLEEEGPGDLDDALEDETPVTFSLRLNTELFVNGGDLVEFLVPIRYSPSDQLALEAVPVIKYFPESTAEEFDYGIKFAVEYRL